MDYEDSYQRRPRPGPRNRSPKKRSRVPRPIIRIGGLVLALVVLLLIIIFSARACARSGEQEAYEDYMAEVQRIVTASDEVGTQLTSLLLSPGDISRADVQTQLEDFVSRCSTLEQQATDLSAPKSLLSGTAHQIFIMVLHFRSTGVNQLKTYLMSALELEDTSGAAIAPAAGGSTTTTLPPDTTYAAGSTEQIMNSMRFLTTSDFIYKEVFEVKVAELLAEKKIGGVTVPTSQFIADPEMATSAEVSRIVTALKTTSNLQAVHGVALKGVLAIPDSKQIVQGGTYDLTQSQSLAFVVTVENQGTMDETNVAVQIELVSSSTSQPPVTVRIPTLKAKATDTVTVEGLSPAPYGEVATLKVTVIPVQDERFTDNNSLTATVIFKL